ncbi:MAG: endonuclease V [Desulfobacterales bacterium]|nr:endonuclease V [Desulfobacterales bacterium]MCP4163752.1 endonuclease V [Deltaproteobacteria bacterium]
MIAIFDVQYGDKVSKTGCVLIDNWSDKTPVKEYVTELPAQSDYISGEFYKRELPCLLDCLNKMSENPEIIVVDGHVWLEENRPGLGHYLYEALGKSKKVIGVAKNSFKGSFFAEKVLRGDSKKPLFVTSDGVDNKKSAINVKGMAGENRLPEMIKRADHLARGFSFPII